MAKLFKRVKEGPGTIPANSRSVTGIDPPESDGLPTRRRNRRRREDVHVLGPVKSPLSGERR